MKVKSLLTDDAKQVLSEESLNIIETAFQKKLKLSVESALTAQDDLYAEKLEKLMKAIDKDHTSKLTRVVEAIDKSNAGKLINVVKRYDRALTVEAKQLKNTLVETISTYLEEFLDEAIPAEAISEATKNKTAIEVLGNLRKVLAIDSALMSESVKPALVDGKKQIDELSAKVEQLSRKTVFSRKTSSRLRQHLFLKIRLRAYLRKRKNILREFLVIRLLSLSKKTSIIL